MDANQPKKISQHVLGLMFHQSKQTVVLIEKNKPAWQYGLLNGVGGKIEHGEAPIDAMVREFKEETGVATPATLWQQFGELSGDDFKVFLFKAFDNASVHQATTMTDERVVIMEVHHLRWSPSVSNLCWLAEAAVDENYGKGFYINVRYSPPPFVLGPEAVLETKPPLEATFLS